MLFPAIALGSPFALCANSWRDTRGHVWRMVGTGVFTAIAVAIPIVGISAIGVAMVAVIAEQGGHVPPWLPLIVVWSGIAALALPIASIGAVVASRYFQAYGRALTGPPAEA